MDRLDPLINVILAKTKGATEEWICVQLDYNEGFISQLRSREKKTGKPQVSPKFFNQVRSFSLQNATASIGIGNEGSPDNPAYLAGQLAMAERLIAKLESDHAEAKADKEKLFSVLAAAQHTINEVLKPIKEKTEAIEANSITIRDHLRQVGRMVRADDLTTMDSLDRLEGNEAGTSSTKASTLERDLGVSGVDTDKNDANRKEDNEGTTKKQET